VKYHDRGKRRAGVRVPATTVIVSAISEHRSNAGRSAVPIL
jgi:hypothetical protein